MKLPIPAPPVLREQYTWEARPHDKSLAGVMLAGCTCNPTCTHCSFTTKCNSNCSCNTQGYCVCN